MTPEQAIERAAQKRVTRFEAKLRAVCRAEAERAGVKGQAARKLRDALYRHAMQQIAQRLAAPE